MNEEMLQLLCEKFTENYKVKARVDYDIYMNIYYIEIRVIGTNFGMKWAPQMVLDNYKECYKQIEELLIRNFLNVMLYRKEI